MSHLTCMYRISRIAWLMHVACAKLFKYFIDFLTSYNGQNHIKTFFKFHAGLWKYCRSGKIQLFLARALFWYHIWYWPYLMKKLFGPFHIVHMIWIIWSISYEIADYFDGSPIEQRPTTRNVMYCQSFRILRMPFAIIFNRIIIFFIIILDVGQYYLISMVDFQSKTAFIQLYFYHKIWTIS